MEIFIRKFYLKWNEEKPPLYRNIIGSYKEMVDMRMNWFNRLNLAGNQLKSLKYDNPNPKKETLKRLYVLID